MSAFSLEEFMVKPNQSTFELLRKDDLILLGKHLKLEVESPMRKREIQKLIMEHLVHVKKSFEQSVLSTYTQEPNITLELGGTPSRVPNKASCAWEHNLMRFQTLGKKSIKN